MTNVKNQFGRVFGGFFGKLWKSTFFEFFDSKTGFFWKNGFWARTSKYSKKKFFFFENCRYRGFERSLPFQIAQVLNVWAFGFILREKSSRKIHFGKNYLWSTTKLKVGKMFWKWIISVQEFYIRGVWHGSLSSVRRDRAKNALFGRPRSGNVLEKMLFFRSFLRSFFMSFSIVP